MAKKCYSYVPVLSCLAPPLEFLPSSSDRQSSHRCLLQVWYLLLINTSHNPTLENQNYPCKLWLCYPHWSLCKWIVTSTQHHNGLYQCFRHTELNSRHLYWGIMPIHHRNSFRWGRTDHICINKHPYSFNHFFTFKLFLMFCNIYKSCTILSFDGSYRCLHTLPCSYSSSSNVLLAQRPRLQKSKSAWPVVLCGSIFAILNRFSIKTYFRIFYQICSTYLV